MKNKLTFIVFVVSLVIFEVVWVIAQKHHTRQTNSTSQVEQVVHHIKVIPYEEDESLRHSERDAEIKRRIRDVEESESIRVIRWKYRYERGSDGEPVVTGIYVEYEPVLRC